MKLRRLPARRSGAAVVEAAIVVPVLLLMLFAIMSGTIMVYTADEVSNVSREGARYASIRGFTYTMTTSKSAATATEVADYVKQQGVMLDASKMTVNVTWQNSNRPGNYVTVEVIYNWPGVGPFPGQTFTSKSTMLMAY